MNNPWSVLAVYHNAKFDVAWCRLVMLSYINHRWRDINGYLPSALLCWSLRHFMRKYDAISDRLCGSKETNQKRCVRCYNLIFQHSKTKTHGQECSVEAIILIALATWTIIWQIRTINSNGMKITSRYLKWMIYFHIFLDFWVFLKRPCKRICMICGLSALSIWQCTCR